MFSTEKCLRRTASTQPLSKIFLSNIIVIYRKKKFDEKNKLYLNFSKLFSDLYENERPQTEDGKIFQGWGGGKYMLRLNR
jgi:hypothetical protein